jgi:hypothetical protein
MSWFGFGGGNKDEDANKSSSYNNSSAGSYEAAETGSYSPDFAAPRSGLGGGAGSSSLEQELMLEQQKMLVQAVMFKLTEAAFQKCVEKPSTSLSSSETNCIKAVVGKYLDASELILARMSK